MDMYMRRKCQECRLKKCLAVGMRPECVVPENQCAIKRKEKKAQKEKDKVQTSSSATVSTTNSASYKAELLPVLMKCESPPTAAIPVSLGEPNLVEQGGRQSTNDQLSSYSYCRRSC